MSRRGAGLVRSLPGAKSAEPATEAPDLQLIETPALGRRVTETARSLLAEGMRPPEVASLLAHAAAVLAQQGPDALSRGEWLTLCAVLWEGPHDDERVTAPGGDA